MRLLIRGKRRLSALALILITAAGLRLYKLTFQSLRWDELFSQRVASRSSLSEVILLGGVGDKHPPGHVLFLHFWIRAFGDSEGSLRLPSVIAGVAGVYVLYLLGKELFSRRVALTAASLCAVGHMPVYYSQDARPYSLLMLLATTCALLALRLQRAQTSPPRWLVPSLALVLSITSYVHYFGLLLVALLGVFQLAFVVRKTMQLRHWAGAYISAAIAYLPWASVLLAHAKRTRSWMKEPSLEVVEALAAETTGGNAGLWLFVIGLAGLSVWQLARSAPDASGRIPSEKVRTIAAVVAWCVVPWVIAIAVSFALVPVLSARNMLISLPPLLLLLALALNYFNHRLYSR